MNWISYFNTTYNSLWKKVFLLVFIGLGFYGSLTYSQRDYILTGTLNYTQVYNTNYGAYDSGLTQGSQFADLLKSDEFIQIMITKNAWSEDIATIRSLYSFEFLDTNNFNLHIHENSYPKATAISGFIQENGSNFISYVIQKRSIDTFLMSYTNALNATQNQFNDLNGLIASYEEYLKSINQYLIQTPNLTLVNPTYTYFETKIYDMKFDLTTLTLTLNNQTLPVTELTGLRDHWLSFESASKIDSPYKQYIQSTITLNGSLNSRLDAVILGLLGAWVFSFVYNQILKLIDNYAFSISNLKILYDIWLDFLNSLKKGFSNWNEIQRNVKLFFKSIKNLIVKKKID